MIAAPDTTSALICSTIDNIIQHQAVHNKVISEIQTATAAGTLSSPVATFAQIKTLPYFNACIQETARLFPSIPVILPRQVSAGGLVLDDGHVRFSVPGGTALGASASVVNRDVHVFGEDADVFRPERWLEDAQVPGDGDRVRQMHRLLFSWGYGSRSCVGKNLAMLETSKFCFQVSTPYLFAFSFGLKGPRGGGPEF